MYFLVNASSPKLLDVTISNFAGAKVMIWNWTTFGVTLIHRSRSYSVFFVNASSP